MRRPVRRADGSLPAGGGRCQKDALGVSAGGAAGAARGERRADVVIQSTASSWHGLDDAGLEPQRKRIGARCCAGSSSTCSACRRRPRRSRRSSPTSRRRLREARRSAARRRRTTASAGPGTGSTSSASPRATASRRTCRGPTPGRIATTSSRRSTTTSRTTASSASSSPAMRSAPTRRPASSSAGRTISVKSPDIVLTLQQRADELDDMVSTTGSAFLGLTVGCARCHDHKFDPISQVDYYAHERRSSPACSTASGACSGRADANRQARAEQAAQGAGRAGPSHGRCRAARQPGAVRAAGRRSTRGGTSSGSRRCRRSSSA